MTELTKKEKKKEYNRAYRASNKEKMRVYREANKEKMRAYQVANKEQLQSYHKSYRADNIERLKAHQKAFYAVNKEEIKAASKAYQLSNKERNRSTILERNYGINLKDYNELLVLQQHCCAICSKHQSKCKKALAVDHNHSTGAVRGLLCPSCNTGIGHLRDSTELLYKAINYLTHHERLQNGRDII